MANKKLTGDNHSREHMIEIGKATQFKSGDPVAKQAQIKGGIQSQINNRKRATVTSYLTQIMNAETSASNAEKMRQMGIDDEVITNSAVIAGSLIKSALKGDIKAVEKVLELEARTDESEKVYELPARVIGKAFVDINRNLEPNKTYVFEGGRGGLKSSFISLKIVELIKNKPDMHACIVRKVQSVLKDSVYAQMKWAIRELGLEEEFTYKVNPLEIIYKKTGQTIFFRGCDDPLKLKSIKPQFGYIGILWKEEKDQLSGAEEERSINQSVLRGSGGEFYDFSSYNPPKSRDNWVNQILLEPDPNRILHHSSYLEAPREWLGTKFIEDAEHLKEVNPQAYEHEYLGVANGEGGNVFENIEVIDLTNEEIATFDTIYQGNDWGWYPDPLAFVRLYYNPAREEITFIDEIYENKWSNSKAAEEIIRRGYDDYVVTCDNAENKSINDYRDLGLNAKPAIKGPGSVEYGMKWLQCRKLRIDPKRTPNIYQEFIHYEYDRDKDGNVISGYPDKDNHTIDATRYALERYCNKRGNQA